MSYSDGLITAPINLGDVDAVLGISSLDVGTQCESPRVNKWSLVKPVRASQPGELSSFASDLGNYGLHLDAFTSLANAISGWESQWAHLRPQNGQDWHRVTDFNGYYHYAEPQYYDCYRVLGLTNSVRVGINWSGRLQSTEIPFREISPDQVSWKLSQCYFGVILVGNGNTLLQCKQSKINPDSSPYQEEVTINTTNFPTTATYTPYPVLVYTTQPSRYANLAALGSGDSIITLPISLTDINNMAFQKQQTDSYAYMYVRIQNATIDRSQPRAYLYGTMDTVVTQGSRPNNWLATRIDIEISDRNGHTVTLTGLTLSQSSPSITFSRRVMTGSQQLDADTSYTCVIRTSWGNGTTREDTQTVMPR